MSSVHVGLVRSVIVSLCLAVAAAAHAQIDIQKFTNGQDANAAPGPTLTVGATVTWTYVVTNTGSRPVTNIVVTDDQGVTVSCPDTTLDAGIAMTCTASGVAVAGQYTNIGTVNATMPDTTVVTDSDPSHYLGQAAPSVAIETRTNGFDADTAPGPSVPIGSTVNWTYVVTNIGSEALQSVAVSDDQGVTVSCPSTTLAIGASMTCTASGLAQAGQYANLGVVTATRAVTLDAVAASDPSHYFGQRIRLEKRTNGVDAAAPPGPLVAFGSAVSWTYEVTNPGPAAVSGISVTDDQGVIVSCPATVLGASQSLICTGSGIAQAGQYTNVGTVTASLPAGGTVTASDTSYYAGNPITIQKLTNGADANVPPGPSVTAGSTVNWTYVVTNHGSELLTGVSVTDDQGVTVTCLDTTLAAGASMTCTASGTAIAGQYANVGTANATSPTFGALTATDPSHYFGQTALLDFGDAADPTHPTLFTTNGARHVLGACVDAELDALTNAGATGDDITAGSAFGTCAVPGDDEDGVTFPTPLSIGRTVTASVVASAPCTLSAWIDFNADGDWSDSGETLFPAGTALATGVNAVSVSIPSNAAPGVTLARFRCTTDGVVGVTGQASDGEVEDHAVTLVVPLPSLAVTKNDALQIDVDNDGLAEPGDTLRYTIVVTNSGIGDATGVAFNDTPGTNTSLVVGSVTTTIGSVTTGNTAGNTSVSVNVGTIPGPGGSATIRFDARIADPLPPGVTTVSNQGTLSGTNFVNILTDDPAAAGAADPTVTVLTVPPTITATKNDALLIDVDNDGLAEPGDTIGYTIVVTNSGTGSALGVAVNDTPGANTSLVVGSVTTTAGSVTSGNTAGNTAVGVNVGTLAPAGGSATITFRVLIGNAPAGVTTVSNQATVTATNFVNVLTDDPATAAAADPTLTPITLMPVVTATKSVALRVDADGNGRAAPGDTVRYTVVLTNSGNGNALAVQFADTPDVNTTLVAGSVTTTAGSVTSGNTAGQTSVTVDIATLPAISSATIVFDVTINAPLPPTLARIVNTGTFTGANFAAGVTDDPSQSGSSNPTALAIEVPAIPTLETWALLVLCSLLALVAIRRAG